MPILTISTRRKNSSRKDWLMSKDKKSKPAKMVNIEIAPKNQSRMQSYIDNYNEKPDRVTPKIKYTDVINEALDFFLKKESKTK